MRRRLSHARDHKLLPRAALGWWGGVLWLLCGAFMTSAKFAVPLPPVRVPTATSFCGYISKNCPLVVLSLDANQRLYTSTDDKQLQARLMEQLAFQCGIVLSETHQQKLDELPYIGVPIGHLNQPDFAHHFVDPPGILADGSYQQLSDYILAAQQVSHRIYQRDVCFALRLDAQLPAYEVNQLFRVLERQGITRFYLITETEQARVIQ